MCVLHAFFDLTPVYYYHGCARSPSFHTLAGQPASSYPPLPTVELDDLTSPEYMELLCNDFETAKTADKTAFEFMSYVLRRHFRQPFFNKENMSKCLRTGVVGVSYCVEDESRLTVLALVFFETTIFAMQQ